MSSVEVRVLGMPSLRVDGEECRVPRKALALLCVLALDGPATRGGLSALLWERERHLARQSLRNAALALRRALAPHAPLRASPERLWLEPGAVWLDAAELAHVPEEELPGLWRGPLLDGLDVSDSAAWDDWVAGREEALAGAYLGRCLTLGTQALERGDAAHAAALAGGALRAVPDSPQAAGLLTQAQRALGQEALARLTATQFRRRFRAQYGEDPDGFAAPPPPALPTGEVALTSSPDCCPLADLPQPLTRFIGRELERRAIVEALRGGRLVTLHGPAGIGKTRLALQVALDLQATCPDWRIHFVPLDDLREPGHVPGRLAQVLGAGPGQDLAAVLAHAPTLLVLDNAEHLLAAAAEWPRLLAACPGLRLLVTSREVLRLRPEQVVTLGGLEVPGPGGAPEVIRQADAVRLFEDRVRGAGAPCLDPSGRLDMAALDDVRGVCVLLGGAPLGLELAAAWTRSQTLPELRRRLEGAVLDLRSPHRDARPRHQSLRAALEHSWALLPAPVREDFSALGVFPASFGAAAAGEILGTPPERLAELVDRALLRRDAAGRYHAHPLVRAFAAEQLAARPGRLRDLRDRHAAHYRAELERLNTEASGGASPPLLAYAAAEEANILALIDHLLARAGADPVSLEGLGQVAEPLLWHFPLRGRPEDGLALCRRVVDTLRPLGKRADRPLAAFLSTQGWLAYFFGDLHEAHEVCGEAAVRAERAGDLLEQTRALLGVGRAASRMGELDRSVAACQAGVNLSGSLGATRRYRLLAGLGLAWTCAGEVEEAAQAFARAWALEKAGEVGSPMDRVACQYGTALMQVVAGRLPEALGTLGAACDLARSFGSVGQLPSMLALAALAHALQACPGSAERVEACGAELRELLGHRPEPWTECLLEQARARLALIRGDLAAARAHCVRAFRAAWPSGNVTVTFWMLPVYARTLAAGGDLVRAAEVVGLLRGHPASGRWTRTQAQALLGEWRTGEGVSGLEAALKRGAGMEVPALFTEALS